MLTIIYLQARPRGRRDRLRRRDQVDRAPPPAQHSRHQQGPRHQGRQGARGASAAQH